MDKIYQLAEKKLGLTLSVSLHAPNDQVRSASMENEVTITAERDGEVVKKISAVPSEKRVWKIVFQGSGTSHISIYIDGNLYAVYELDFDYQKATQVEDHSNDF